MTVQVGNPILEGYRSLAGSYDEMLAGENRVRPHWQYLMDAISGLGLETLHERSREAQRQLNESGVAYRVYSGQETPDRSWRIDPLPLLISSEEWREIELGLMQRAELMNLILKDLYGPQELIRHGILPMEVVYLHSGFLRACHPYHPQTIHPLTLYAVDLMRGQDGRMWVLNDRTQAPSGAGYALVNRMTMARVMPSLFRDSQVHRLALFFQSLRNSLTRLAPFSETEPRIVVLTPGPLNETYFEHSYLASYLGYTLAQGEDLVVQDGKVWLRAMRQLQRVDVILRRLDDQYCDPLELRPDSLLGVPGLMQAVRNGTVAIGNPLGSGLLENAALNAFMPAIAKHFLGQDIRLPSPASWWCGQPQACQHVLSHLDQLVIKPLNREPGDVPLFGSQLSTSERERLRNEIRANPSRYVAQEFIHSSGTPTLTDQGLEGRASILRSFMVSREDGYVVMPGGLTRIAPAQESMIVTGQAGAFSKDTWILASEPEKHVTLQTFPAPRIAAMDLRESLPGGTAENLFWFARYAERAEQTARLLRTILRVYRNVIEFRDPVEASSLDTLLQALTQVTGSFPGFWGEEGKAARAEPRQELQLLILDEERTGGHSFNLRAMLSAAYVVRDRVSSDTRRVINDLHVQLDVMKTLTETAFVDIEDHLDTSITSLTALAGLAQESMMRGQAWLFLDMGRRLERAQFMNALLRAIMVNVHETEQETLLLSALLSTTESSMAYRRSYHDEPQCEPALTMLIYEESNPRSLLFQIQTLRTHLELLPREENASDYSPQLQQIHNALSRLQSAKPPGLGQHKLNRRNELNKLLSDVDLLLRDVADTLARDYFADLRGPQQLIASGWDT